MTVRTSAGTTLKVSASIPATFDPTGYNALTMTRVGEVSDLAEFGREYNLVTFNPVGSRGVVKKGSFNPGAITIQVDLDPDDARQLLLKSASTSDSDNSFCVTTQNGNEYYFQAQVMSFKVNVGSVDQITTASAGTHHEFRRCRRGRGAGAVIAGASRRGGKVT